MLIGGIIVSKLEDLFKGYREWRRSRQGLRWVREKNMKRVLFSHVFSKETLEKASDEEFQKALTAALMTLWSMDVWVYPEKRIQQIIMKNGVRNLRPLFKDLLYGRNPFEDRFTRFLEKTWGLGLSSTTEILSFTDPERYAMWNKRVLQALEKLGKLKELEEKLGVNRKGMLDSHRVKGRQYNEIIRYLDKLRRDLGKIAGEKLDFLELNIFLYYFVENSM